RIGRVSASSPWAMDLGRVRDCVILALRRLLWVDILGIVRALKPDGGRVLDVGCGSGIFLHCAKRVGFHCQGVEQSQDAAACIRRQFALDVTAGGVESLDSDARFDLVTMFHVLEHVADPAHTLQRLRGHIKDGGHLLLEVPNITSWGLRLFGKRWIGLDLPRHITHFSETTLKRLLGRTGYRVVSLRRFTWRNSPSMLAASAWPQALLEGKSQLRARPLMAYLRLTAQAVLYVLFIALALLERACGNGEVLLVLAEPTQVRS
ncbi:MAG: class I SAM-dependent methyltransferase, partial [Elusimicrobiota bacterium]